MTSPAPDRNESFLRFLRERHGAPESVTKIAARLLEASDDGHTALSVETDEELRELKAHPAVCSEDPARPAPLFLRDGLLQTWSVSLVERGIAAHLEKWNRSPEGKGIELTKRDEALLEKTFATGDDLQKRAARIALTRRWTLLTGGAGTGKTWVASRILALSLHREPGLRFALAAPTGKAAQRLGESIRQALRPAKQGEASLPPEIQALAPAIEAIASGARTLHRLLGWNPGSGRLEFHRRNRLPFDVFLVDEASMIDGPLWLALLDALPDHARLVILGDEGQLESVAPGRVLGSLIEASRSREALAEAHVELTRSNRFKHAPAIGLAAEALRKGRPDELLALCAARKSNEGVARKTEDDGLVWIDPSRGVARILEDVWDPIRALATAREAGEALEALARFRILLTVNHGPWGVEGWNRAVADLLRRKGIASPTTPVLVRVNDPSTGLFNGDLGVLIREIGEASEGNRSSRPPVGSVPSGVPSQAFFGDPSRPVAHARAVLPENAPAWAMTVHRSQGSEYDEILLVLPPARKADDEEVDRGERLLIPELLYTALTRAKKRVTIVAEEAVLRRAATPGVKRRSGLAGWLAEAGRTEGTASRGSRDQARSAGKATP